MMNRIVQILMERDELSQQEAQQMFGECRQRLIHEAVPSGDCELAEEILVEDLGLELDYLMDILL